MAKSELKGRRRGDEEHVIARIRGYQYQAAKQMRNFHVKRMLALKLGPLEMQ
ncbi:hypothetical protein ABGN05_29385 [Aquibium sp. LZ166]|uniref:Transposase n=1 Tax=Aquibium pacificus TaxID=3153579 RepID=A0ABV3SSG9_9HYPH